MGQKVQKLWGLARYWTIAVCYTQLLVSILVLIYGTVEVIELNKRTQQPVITLDGNSTVTIVTTERTDDIKLHKQLRLQERLNRELGIVELSTKFCNVLWLLTLTSMVGQLLLGVTLLYGMILKNSGVLLTWCLLEIVFLALAMAGVGWMLMIEQFLLSTWFSLALLFAICGVHVVNVYRQEVRPKAYLIKEDEDSYAIEMAKQNRRARDGRGA